jgi:hypothetical protein
MVSDSVDEVQSFKSEKIEIPASLGWLWRKKKPVLFKIQASD